MKILVKTSLKLLLRTKLLWLFLIMMPLLSTFIMKNKVEYSAYLEDEANKIELDDANEKVSYNGAKGAYAIKVYDSSKSQLSDHLLQNIADAGMFTICRADVTDISVDDVYIKERIEFDGYEDRMGAAMFIPSDFDEKVKDGEYSDALMLYILSDDKRGEALERELRYQLSILNDPKMYKMIEDVIPQKKVVTIAGSSDRNLTIDQNNQKSQMGYAFSFMTLGFVFCGFFVAYNSIQEQKNGVLTRINLTKMTTLKYFISKFLSLLIIVTVMTAALSVCSLLLNMEDLGMSRCEFIGMIFMMGLIFGAMSMFIGILMGDVMGASVAAFSVWCTSGLFGGVYFPLTHTSNTLKAISFMMPQKWFLEGTEMIYVGDRHAFLMLICITAAYLSVVISLGSLGLKVKNT